LAMFDDTSSDAFEAAVSPERALEKAVPKLT
jgi:hypothetical protein